MPTCYAKNPASCVSEHYAIMLGASSSDPDVRRKIACRRAADQLTRANRGFAYHKNEFLRASLAAHVTCTDRCGWYWRDSEKKEAMSYCQAPALSSAMRCESRRGCFLQFFLTCIGGEILIRVPAHSGDTLLFSYRKIDRQRQHATPVILFGENHGILSASHPVDQRWC